MLQGKKRRNDAGGSVVGTLLRMRRRAAGMSQQALARRAGLAQTILRRIERGGNATLDSVGRLTRVFGPETRRGVVLMLTMPLSRRRALLECSRLEAELQRTLKALREITAMETDDDRE